MTTFIRPLNMSAGTRSPATLVLLVVVVSCGNSLRCHPAEYEVNNECCPMCSAGSRVKTDCTRDRSTSCLPCVEGTFTEKANGMKTCLACTVCDQGSGLKVRRPCSFTADTGCDALEGFLCVIPTKDGCAATKKHRSCEPGQYIHQKGTAFTDTLCSNCSHGTFSNGSTTTCQPHTKCEELDLQETAAGTSSADVQCGAKTGTGPIVAGVVVSVAVLAAVVGGVVVVYKKKVNKEQELRKYLPGYGGSSRDEAALADLGVNGRSEDLEEGHHPEVEPFHTT